MTLGVLTGTVLVFLKNIEKNHKSGRYWLRFPSTSLNLIFFILLAFLIFQIIPLPDSILRFLSPEAGVVGGKSLLVSISMIPGQEEKNWFMLSPYAYPVRLSIIRFTVYGLFFFGLVQVLNSKKRIDLAISLILITGCFEALYGLMQTYSGSEHIWWFKKLTYGSDVCGTYINRNHFAGFMEMGLLLAAAFAAALSPRRKKNRKEFGEKRRFSSRVSDALSVDQEFTKRVLIVFSGVVLGVGLIFSASRGGMIAAAGAMLLMGLLLAFRREYRRKGIILLFLFLLISAYAVKIGVEYPLGRFKDFYSTFEARTRLAEKTIDLFEDYKFAGVGIGNFKYAFPKYQSPQDKEMFFRFAHNDWAQYLAEAGIVGFCLLVIGISYYIFRTMKLWKKRKDPYAVCLGVLPLVVLAAMGVHSYSDFNLHIPANFMTLVAIIGIGSAALHLDRPRRQQRMLYRYHTLPLLSLRGILVPILLLGLVLWTGFWATRHFIAEAYCNTVTNSTMNRDQNPPVAEVAKAIGWDRSNAGYWYKLSETVNRKGHSAKGIAQSARETEEDVNAYLLLINRVLEEEGVNDYSLLVNRDREEPDKNERNDATRITNQTVTNNTVIRLALERAVALNPFNAQYHLQLGWAYAHLWKEPDYHKKWLPAADVSMERAAYFAGDKYPRLHVELGNYWVMRSTTILPSNSKHQAAWSRAFWHYKKAQSLETGGELKRMKKKIRDYVWYFYPDEGMIKQTIQ